MNYFFKNPIYFKILSLFEIKENKNIFCEIRCGKNLIEYNPNYLEDKSTNEIQDLLITELNRIILRHPFRMKPENCDESIWYEASNITINQDKLEKYKLPPNHNFEFYYKKLLELEDKPKLETMVSRSDKKSSSSSEEYDDEGESTRNSSDSTKAGKNQEGSKLESTPREKAQKSDKGNQSDVVEESSENVSESPDLKDGEKANRDKPLKKSNSLEKNGEKTRDNSDSGDENTETDRGEKNSSKNQNGEQEESGSDEKANSLEENGDMSRDNSDSEDGKTDGEDGDANSSKNQKTKQEKSDSVEQDNSLENNGNEKSRDNSNWKNGPTELWGEDEVFEETINQIVYKTFTEKSWGTVSSNINEQIKIEYNEKLPNYRKLMQYFKSKIKGSEKKYTRTKPNRRYGFLQMGCIDKPHPSKLLIFVDSSSSVDYVMLKNFMETIKYILMKGKFIIDLFLFDTKLKAETPQRLKKSDLQNFTVVGLGGTSFKCIFDYLKSNQKKYDGVIIFTDGYAPEVKLNFKLQTRVGWILYNSDGFQRWMKKIGLCSVMSE
jgi:predicted metal-dependent peptidase